MACDYENNADVAGAINVLRLGEAVLSREGQDYAWLACADTSPEVGT